MNYDRSKYISLNRPLVIREIKNALYSMEIGVMKPDQEVQLGAVRHDPMLWYFHVGSRPQYLLDSIIMSTSGINLGMTPVQVVDVAKHLLGSIWDQANHVEVSEDGRVSR